MKRILSVLLAAALLLSCVGCIRLSCTMPVRYANAEKYTAGNFTYDASAVKKVEIEWAYGGITLKNGTGTLSVSESGAENLKEEEKLHWWLDGSTLKIRFCKSGQKLSLTDAAKKDLTVELPAFADVDIDVASGKVVSESMLELGTLKLNTASGGLDLRYLSAKEVRIDTASGGAALGKVSVTGDFDVDSASGGLTVEEITANEIDVNSASGGVALQTASAETIRIGSVSGGVTLGILRASKIKINSTSGSIKLTITDQAAGAKIKFSAVSGSINVKLPAEKNDDVYTIGSGLIDTEISVVSGSVIVE